MSTTSALPTSEAPRTVGAPTLSPMGPDVAPRVRLQRILLALCVIAIPLTLARSWQLVWQPLLPIPLLLMSARAVARVQVGAVLSLLLLGGAVTTYRVGMAVPDWPGTFYENMWTYPLADMLERGYGVTLEHTHRLWASAVGLIAICQVLVGYIHRERRAIVGLSWVALLAIIGQGLLGGTRVLEDSQHLAFLHGALAQLVFAIIVCVAVVTSRTWASAPRFSSELAARTVRTAGLASALVYVQIVLGAATRHSGHHVPLALHLALAVGALVVVTMLIGRLGAAHDEGVAAGEDRRPLRALRIVTTASLHTQILLGVLVLAAIYMLSKGFEGEVSVGEAVFASLHVAVGAVLFSACVASWLWSRRILGSSSPSPRP